MKKPLNRNNIDKFELMRETLNLEDAMKEADRCLLCEDAPCSQGCPAGTDPGKFIRQIKFQNFKGAARTIRNNNPLGAVCSFICPVDKLCEKKCSVKALEDPINISGLQRFACEYAAANQLETLEPSTKEQGKVAVIGAGPAGVGCAATLAKLNYDVTIFEKSSATGGVVKWNIPSYRVAEEAIQADLKNLTDLGVNVRYDEKITDVNALLAQGFQAVFIGGGLSEPIELPMYADYDNAMNFVEFLYGLKSKKGQLELQNKTIAVIGGGSVAMDVACSAAALGAKVYAISLEPLANLPADEEEIHIAHTLHVNFKAGSQIIEVIADGRHIVGLRGHEVTWKEPNNFIPSNATAIKGSEFNIPVDYVVQAIGSKADKMGEELKTAMKNVLVVKEDYSTNIPGVFAGGDIVNGGATVVKAVADGKEAANSMHNYIRGGK